MRHRVLFAQANRPRCRFRSPLRQNVLLKFEIQTAARVLRDRSGTHVGEEKGDAVDRRFARGDVRDDVRAAVPAEPEGFGFWDPNRHWIIFLLNLNNLLS